MTMTDKFETVVTGLSECVDLGEKFRQVDDRARRQELMDNLNIRVQSLITELLEEFPFDDQLEHESVAREIEREYRDKSRKIKSSDELRAIAVHAVVPFIVIRSIVEHYKIPFRTDKVTAFDIFADRYRAAIMNKPESTRPASHWTFTSPTWP